MAAQTPANEDGFRVLEEFVCDAIPGPGIPVAGAKAGTCRSEVQVLAELVTRADAVPVSDGRIAELRALSTPDLLDLVRTQGRDLATEELRVIHDVAIDRLAAKDRQGSDDADELSRDTMMLALNRLA